jgi:hypothetical protein
MPSQVTTTLKQPFLASHTDAKQILIKELHTKFDNVLNYSA